MKYEFSMPMPYSKQNIVKIQEINKNIKKSKITSFYFSLPSNCEDFTGFEMARYNFNKITNYEYWEPLIVFSLECGFDFVYLLSSPKVFHPSFDDIQNNLKKLDKLLNNLRKLGCNKVRVCNPQLIGYLNRYYPDFQIYLSTSAEFQSIIQYSNYFFMFDNIKEIVPSFDLNKNFNLLVNIKKLYPNIIVELMVNEGCIKGCTMRKEHGIFTANLKDIDNIANIFFSNFFFNSKCSQILNKNFFKYLTQCNIIYPWELNEYKKIGINNFKFVGRNSEEFTSGKYIDYYYLYLKGIDDIKNIENIPIQYFNNYILQNKSVNLTVKEYKKYSPQINHFVKYGHLCTSICGVKCKYCFKYAEKLINIMQKKNFKNNNGIYAACTKI